MPYIPPANRAKYDALIKELVEILKALPVDVVDGEINYVITKVFKEVYPLRYFHINKAIGVLECIKQEYYRKVAGPYEDKRCAKLGEV